MNWTKLAFYARKILLAYQQWKARKPGEVIPFPPPDRTKETLKKLSNRKKKASPPKDAA